MDDVLFPGGVAQRIFEYFDSAPVAETRVASCVTRVSFSPMILLWVLSIKVSCEPDVDGCAKTRAPVDNLSRIQSPDLSNLIYAILDFDANVVEPLPKFPGHVSGQITCNTSLSTVIGSIL